jgi:hypothetical protein
VRAVWSDTILMSAVRLFLRAALCVALRVAAMRAVLESVLFQKTILG